MESQNHIGETATNPLFDNRIWLSTSEAAKYLGKTTNAIWILVCRGELLKRKWKRRLYFKRTELDHLLETSLLK